MNELIAHLKTIPVESRLIYFYVGGGVLFNIYTGYRNSMTILLKHRKHKETMDENDEIISSHYPNCNTEWEAIDCGARNNFYTSLCESCVWPLAIANRITPYFVYKIS